ncbi:hypothetical protein BLNAU_20654 [Blattamonas nauphoetae]|uniref:Uncharacterized protein n=1 Tax=Blattamonas nauphoetae TaxID=2049346 RepID=A0ABQ9WY55_9EUKA|nr:hypothetical protein BLNAU_20654 [Blattamonas nauphoetae]
MEQILTKLLQPRDLIENETDSVSHKDPAFHHSPQHGNQHHHVKFTIQRSKLRMMEPSHNSQDELESFVETSRPLCPPSTLSSTLPSFRPVVHSALLPPCRPLCPPSALSSTLPSFRPVVHSALLPPCRPLCPPSALSSTLPSFRPVAHSALLSPSRPLCPPSAFTPLISRALTILNSTVSLIRAQLTPPVISASPNVEISFPKVRFPFRFIFVLRS